MITLRVKKIHPDAILPKQANNTDSGYDIVALEDGKIDKDNLHIEYRTGLAIAPTTGYHVLIHPRSSISKFDLSLCNGIGLCDNSFRGEYLVRFKIIPRLETKLWYKVSDQDYRLYDPKDPNAKRVLISEVQSFFEPRLYKKGDKIAQLVVEKTEYAEIQEVIELDETIRGAGGFGSTGL